jgi:hypothetical protein
VLSVIFKRQFRNSNFKLFIVASPGAHKKSRILSDGWCQVR